MPIYQYICENCTHELEEMQKFSDPLLVSCPQCEEETLKRKLSAVAFHLKGGGWYKDGYGGRSNKAPEKSESPASKDTTPKTDKNSSSESKPSAEKTSSEKSTAA